MMNQAHIDPDALEEPLLDAKQLAVACRVPVSWIYSKTALGEIPHYRLGRYPRYRRSQVLTWLEQQRQAAK